MYGISLRVWGERALFTRPEMKAERVSYDVITPSAARGILDAIHWKPAIRWVIDEIWVLKPVQFTNIRRNEVFNRIPSTSVSGAMNRGDVIYQAASSPTERQQRASILLRDVEYVIRAHFELTDQAGEEDTPEKHYNIFLRRARAGQCFHRPYFGCREFPVDFELMEQQLPKPIDETRDLGWMLFDVDYVQNMQPVFFRAQMDEGVVRIPKDLIKGVGE